MLSRELTSSTRMSVPTYYNGAIASEIQSRAKGNYVYGSTETSMIDWCSLEGWWWYVVFAGAVVLAPNKVQSSRLGYLAGKKSTSRDDLAISWIPRSATL